jgi:flagellar motor switch protein FliG
MDPKSLPGSLKVAILLQALGKEASEKILNGLDESEKSIIKSHLSQMGTIPSSLVEKVASEFTEMVSRGKSRQKLGEPTTKEARDNNGLATGQNPNSANLRALQSLKPDHLLELIKDEHPQTIAIIIVHLEPRVASEILRTLPDELKTDVALRIANLDKITAEMIEEINEAFEQILKNKESSITQEAGGISCLVEILKQINDGSGDLILREIEENDPELAAQLRQSMFVFEDLTLVDDRGLQKLLRAVETKELAMALKAAPAEVREKISKNLSEKAREMLMEEIDLLGPVRMKDVEDAQQMIIKIVQEMEAKKELMICGRGGEEIVA